MAAGPVDRAVQFGFILERMILRERSKWKAAPVENRVKEEGVSHPEMMSLTGNQDPKGPMAVSEISSERS